MDFEPDTEHRMIADSFAKVFSTGNAAGQDRRVWTDLEDLELLRVAWPEAQGGFAAGIGDLVHTLVEAGRNAAPEPLIGAAILPGLALARAGALAPETSDAVLCLAVARDELQLIDGRIDGVIKVVPGADVAQSVLVCLPDDRLFLLPVDAVGLSREAYTLVDGRGGADLHFASVDLRAGILGGVMPGMGEWLRDAAATAFAADALGALLALRDMTQDYLKTRQQFGRPLGSFQVLQHAMVDIYQDIEHFFSLVHLAARTCDSPDAALRMRAVSAVKRYLGGRMRRVVASAIQLHGGIGVTEEYPLGRLVKRVLVADMLNGSADSHGARLAKLIAEETKAMPRKIRSEKEVA